jgi:hypothetical protein
MARMTIRSTYALDEQTDQRIKHLAKVWHVSQAEVIRRSVCAAAEQAEGQLSPADVVACYAEGKLPRSRAETRRLIELQQKQRRVDDEHRLDVER